MCNIHGIEIGCKFCLSLFFFLEIGKNGKKEEDEDDDDEEDEEEEEDKE